MKIQYYNKKVSAFCGISLINHNFNKTGMSALIDKELGLRVKTVGFQYSEIFRNMSNVYLSGGDVIEDIKTHDITINRSRMDAGSYSKNIIDVVSNHSNLFYIRSNKSMAFLDKVRNIKDWKEVTIKHRKYEVASIKFTQFFEDCVA